MNHQMGNILSDSLKDYALETGKEAGKEAVNYIWSEYKFPIVAVSSIVVISLILNNLASIAVLTEKKK